MTRETPAPPGRTGPTPRLLEMLAVAVITGALSGTIAVLLEIVLIVPARVAFRSKSLAATLLLPPIASAPFFMAANVTIALGLVAIALAKRRLERDMAFRALAWSNGLLVALSLGLVYEIGTRDGVVSLIDRLALPGLIVLLAFSLLLLPWVYRRVLLPALGRHPVFRGTMAAVLAGTVSVGMGLMLAGSGGKSAATAGGRGPAAGPATPGADNLLLITIDTQRADCLGCYREGSVETPNIDRLAREGVRFGTCISQVPTTLPSHTTIMTGTYPPFHRVRTNHGYKVPASLETLAEVLRARGYRTAGFVSAFVLDARFGLDQGFDLYDCDLGGRSLLFTGVMRRTLSSTAWRAICSRGGAATQRRAGETTKRAVRWLQSAPPGPFFLWVHYFDPHSPYDPPEPYRTRYLDEVDDGLEGSVTVVTLAGTRSFTRVDLEREKARYRGEVAWTDENVGALIDTLRGLGLLDRTLVVLTADHGESFAENDYYGHGKKLNPPSISVPLIFRRPGVLPAGVTVSGMARSVDIMPTILDLLGIAGPDAMQGETLRPCMSAGGAVPDRAIYCETLTPPIDALKRIGLIRGGWKFVMAPQGSFEALYRLSTDPAELENLVESERSKAGEMKTRLGGVVREISSSEAAERIDLDEDAISALRALGYVQ